jgi:integrase
MACIRRRRGRRIIDFYDQHGKRRWRTLPKGTTKKKALEELRAIEEAVGKKTFMTMKEIPLFKDVAREFMEAKEPNLRANTFDTYQGIVNNHFADLDELRIRQITTARVERFIRDRQGEGRNLSTLRKTLMVMGPPSCSAQWMILEGVHSRYFW